MSQYIAEKSRPSSCLFADRVARTCIAEYHRKICHLNENGANLQFAQTVFAAIVMSIDNVGHNVEGTEGDTPSVSAITASEASCGKSISEDGCEQVKETPHGDASGIVSENTNKTVPAARKRKRRKRTVAQSPLEVLNFEQLHVVACGVGTKFCSSVSAGDNLKFRDCHAEVLARRAFQHFLLDEMARSKPQHQGAARHDGAVGKENEPSFAPIFLVCPQQDQTNDLFQLRAGVRFHLYTTSAPCGNATIKRWGAAQPAPFFGNLSENEIPIEQVRVCQHIVL